MYNQPQSNDDNNHGPFTLPTVNLRDNQTQLATPQENSNTPKATPHKPFHILVTPLIMLVLALVFQGFAIQRQNSADQDFSRRSNLLGVLQKENPNTYVFFENQVYFRSDYISFKNIPGPIPTEPDSFTILTYQGKATGYAKDSNAVYWGGQTIDAHHDTFKVVGNFYGTDGSKSFFQGREIKNADGNSLREVPYTAPEEYDNSSRQDFSVAGLYAKDATKVFYRHTPIAGDPNTIIYDTFIQLYRDKNFIFLHGKTLELDLVKQINNSHYHQYGDTMYYLSGRYSKPVENVDISTFHAYSGDPHKAQDINRYFNFGRDDPGNWRESPKISQTNNLEKKQLSTNHYTDGDWVYWRHYTNSQKNEFGDHVLIGADPSSFATYGQPFENYSRDANYAYYLHKIIKGVDLQTFTPLSSNYAKDKSAVYWQYLPISRADSSNFRVLPLGKGLYARDNTHAYWSGQILAGADPDRLTIMDTQSEYLAKTDNGLYFDRSLPITAEQFALKLNNKPISQQQPTQQQ